MGTDAVLVWVTTPDAEQAAALARVLVEEGLAACGNVLPGVRSIYRWEGKLCDEPEALLVLKTQRRRFEAVRARVVALHPYACPEVIEVPIEAGHAPYLAWIAANAGGPGGTAGQ